jgi:hypothetical protein
VSDAQLAALDVRDGALVAPGGRYRAVIVPRVNRMSVETLRTLANLLERGAPVLFESLPADVPGYGRLGERRAELAKLLVGAKLRQAIANDLHAALGKLDVRREGAPAAGLAHIRRARADGHDYFFVNLSGKPFDGWLRLGTPADGALLLDPVSGRAGMAAVKGGAAGKARVYLQLASGESLLLRTQRTRAHGRSAAAPWHYVKRVSAGMELAGPWQVQFLTGGPSLPAAGVLTSAGSWTGLHGGDTERFSGTARYRIEFDAPGRATDWLLELGDVREAARVRLNGREIGAAWSLPFTLRLGEVRPRGNVLEVDVTNSPANRIRDLDRRKVEWKIMRDINLASLRYGKLEASGWEVSPAGLLGPVRLVPLAPLDPE